MFGFLKGRRTYSTQEVKIPEGCREMTEYEKRFVVNGGAPSMTPEDQYNIAEAYRTGDQGKVDEIMSHYQNSGSGTTTPTPPSTTGTTPTTTTPPASVPTTPPANGSEEPNNTTPPGSSGNGGSGSSGGGSGTGGSSGSGSGSGSGGNSSPSSTNSTTTSQHKPSVSEQEGYLKAGLSHVEDYKKAARKTLGIRGSSVTGSSFKGKEIKGWRNNGDGTHTVTAEDATLWDLYGPNWRELSGYEGDPTKLHVGDTVGKKIKVNPGAGEMTITDYIAKQRKLGIGTTVSGQTVGGKVGKENTASVKAMSGTTINAKSKSFPDKLANFFTSLFFPKGLDVGYFNSIDKKDASSVFNRQAGTKYVHKRSDDDKPLLQASIGKKEALGVGYSVSAGVVINHNNCWDSGILLSGGLGFGIEKAIDITNNTTVNQMLDVGASSVDFNKPTSTADLEGFSWNAYSSAGLGISYELGRDTLKGIQVGAVGGGVYYEGTVVLTPGEMVEGTYNSGVFIMNQIFNNSGSGALGRFVQFDYIELDGKN